MRILQIVVLFTYCTVSSAGATGADVNNAVLEPRPLLGFDEIPLETAAVVPLEKLESFVSNAPEILVAIAELEETLYRLERAKDKW